MLELSRLEDASRSRHTFGLPSGDEFGFELRFGGLMTTSPSSCGR